MIFRPKSNFFEIKILCPQGFSIIIFWLDNSSFHHRLCPAQLFRLLRTKCRFIKQVSGRSGKLSGSITFAQSFRCITSPYAAIPQCALGGALARPAPGCWVLGAGVPPSEAVTPLRHNLHICFWPLVSKI